MSYDLFYNGKPLVKSLISLPDGTYILSPMPISVTDENLKIERGEKLVGKKFLTSAIEKMVEDGKKEIYIASPCKLKGENK